MKNRIPGTNFKGSGNTFYVNLREICFLMCVKFSNGAIWRSRANFVYPDPGWSDSNETKEEIKEGRGDL